MESVGLAQAFKTAIMPIMYDIGQVLFFCAVLLGGYLWIQGRSSDAIRRIRDACYGYIFIRLSEQFINLIDKIAESIKF
jgi:hypothetical protein